METKKKTKGMERSTCKGDSQDSGKFSKEDSGGSGNSGRGGCGGANGRQDCNKTMNSERSESERNEMMKKMEKNGEDGDVGEGCGDDDNNNNNDDDNNNNNDDDLRMFEDDDDDSVDEGLYGQGRHRPADFTTGAPPGSFEMFALNRRELEERKNRHHEVVKRILAEFDLDEVMERYRGKGVIQDLSHANRKFRMWLEQVTGDGNVQLSDRKWHELLRQKVMEDYEHKQKERERQLAEAEVQRIQRLRLQGILTSRDTGESSGGHGHGRSKKKSHRNHDGRTTRQHDLYTRPSDDIQTQMSIINISIAENSKGNQTRNPSEDESGSRTEESNVEKKDDGKTDKTKNKTNTKTGSVKTKVEQRNEPEEEIKSQYEEQTRDKENGATQGDDYRKNGHIGMCGSMGLYRNPNVQSLYKEEDLHQLYAHAEMLVRPGNAVKSNHK